MKPATIVLKPGKEMALRRFHPWIFSGAIQQIDGEIAEGDVVMVVGSRNEFLGLGHNLGGSLAIKIFSFKKLDVNEDFWFSKLREAYEMRRSLGLLNGGISNAYRLVFSEGDGMPGLIIDYYNGVAVIQTHTLGMHRLIPLFSQLLQRLYGSELKAVYNKSAETMGRTQHAGSEKGGKSTSGKNQLIDDQFIFGASDPVEILETGHRFMVDFVRGQKTGFFLDQRSNRMFAQFYAKGRSVLNACCYSGAFSVYAMKGGATGVDSVDSSRAAIGWTEENLLLNSCAPGQHRSIVADIKKYLAETSAMYDMIILDPPAFAKNHQVTNNALHAYIHINAEALKRLNPGGILFTFSCSQPISREMFRSAIQSAAIETRKEVRIIHQLTQGPDHPVDACHPEGEYLKGLIVAVR
jgi:23S rRNA (cytosine1962-C5)-methyltransferase